MNGLDGIRLAGPGGPHNACTIPGGVRAPLEAAEGPYQSSGRRELWARFVGAAILIVTTGFGCGRHETPAPQVPASTGPAQAALLASGEAGESASDRSSLPPLPPVQAGSMPGRSDGGEAVARQPNGTLAYIQGIEALEAADFKGAVTHLTRAIEADDDNADYHRARGVAHTLAEDFPAAIADLQRALKLRPGDREARLWLAAAYRMSGDPQTAAQYFTHGGEVPASYPSLVYNDMAMDYFSPRYRGVFYDRQANRTVEAHEPVKTLFAEVAAAYARRHTVAGAAATDVIRARMKARLGRGDYAAAVRDLLLLRRAAPDDSALRGEWALCLVGLGNALTAREELTRTLDVMPLWAEGYLGRAQAAAMLGDERRATADLGVASALGASSVSAVRGKVAKLLGPRVPDDAVARLARAVESEAPWPALVDAALAVQRWCNARRFHYDEAYQDRIQVLSMAIRVVS